MKDVDRDLIDRWREGDRSAFEELVRLHMSDAYLVALGFTGNPDDARDLSQDAFIKAFEARRKFDPKRPFYPWFYRVLKNHCLNFLQRRRKTWESLHHKDGAEERFASGASTPLEKMEKRERVRLVRAAIERLSFEHREIVVLKNFKGYSYQEIATILDIPIGTVMSRLYYARKTLKQIVLEFERSGLDDLQGARDPGDPTHGEVV
ncbi:MAG: RNA polymerase sigma factor [bacterium]|nr:RNA polymerase sigma factor [bacterium]